MSAKPKVERRPAPDARRARPATGARTGPRRDVLMVEVLDAAAILFAARGFAATSLQDIAKEIGLSRTSMYYYFPSKDALLAELVRGVTERTDAIFAELGVASEASHAARLTEAARRLVLWVTDPQTLFKLLDRNEHELPADLAAAHRDTKRRVLQGMAALVEGGIASGEFKPVNAHVAAFAILGMCNWTAWWFSPNGSLSRTEIADQIATLALASVRASEGKAGKRNLADLVGTMRETLDLIAVLDPAKPAPKPARSSRRGG